MFTQKGAIARIYDVSTLENGDYKLKLKTKGKDEVSEWLSVTVMKNGVSLVEGDFISVKNFEITSIPEKVSGGMRYPVKMIVTDWKKINIGT